MPKFTVEQMAEVWYTTEVEADTPLEAIAKTQQPNYNHWSRKDGYDYVDTFIVLNQETNKEYHYN